MQIKRYRLREGKIPFLTIFTVGLFAGMLFMNLRKSILLENTGLLDEYTLYHMKYMTVDSSALFYYVLKQRFSSLLGLVLLSTTYLGIVVCCGAALWYGICAGAFLATAILRYGIRGILLVVVGMFPQYLIYIPATVVLFFWCRKVYDTIYLDRTCGAEGGRSFLLPKRLLQLAGILIAFLVGCVLESFSNPHFMKGLLQFF